MKKSWKKGMLALSCSLGYLVGCGDGGGGGGSTEAPQNQSNQMTLTINAESELPTCDIGNKDQLIYVVNSAAFKRCSGLSWEAIAISNGKDGNEGSAGINSLVSIEAEPKGENCESAGQAIKTGLDQNRNEKLDSNEIAKTVYVCNPEDLVAPLIKTTTIASNDSVCTAGGILVELGDDNNDDGILDSTEISSSKKLCNGATGATGAVGTTGEAGADGLMIDSIWSFHDDSFDLSEIVCASCDAYIFVGDIRVVKYTDNSLYVALNLVKSAYDSSETDFYGEAETYSFFVSSEDISTSWYYDIFKYDTFADMRVRFGVRVINGVPKVNVTMDVDGSWISDSPIEFILTEL